MTAGREKTVDLFNIYRKEVNKFPLLTFEEEQELGKRVKEYGCQESREKLINCNLRLVISIASKFFYSGMDINDLIEEGNIGLMRSVEKFDYTRGNKFSTYASWEIKQRMQRFIVEQKSNIPMPNNKAEKHQLYLRVVYKLTKELHRDPIIEEIAEQMKYSVENLKSLLSNIPEFVELDSPIITENGDENEHSIPVSYDYESICMARQVVASKKLSEKERAILNMRFFQDLNLDTIGKHFKITRERVRQIEVIALKKLRKQYAERK